ncbi:MAG: hypothetical protein L0Z62_35620 [Gemmataceae bacterium]|nr:hypothetical protein [Gemmataceae bacterium]
MTHRLVLLTLAVSFLAVNWVFADSSGTRLTTKNIGDQPLRFVISAEQADSDSVRFTVSVQRRQGKGLSAWLGVLDGEARIVNCQVSAEKREGANVYEITVSRKYLEKSKLLLEETDAAQRGLPGGAVYWFYLQDFAPASPGGKGQQKK